MHVLKSRLVFGLFSGTALLFASIATAEPPACSRAGDFRHAENTGAACPTCPGSGCLTGASRSSNHEASTLAQKQRFAIGKILEKLSAVMHLRFAPVDGCDRSSNVMHMPKVTLYNGTEAIVDCYDSQCCDDQCCDEECCDPLCCAGGGYDAMCCEIECCDGQYCDVPPRGFVPGACSGALCGVLVGGEIRPCSTSVKWTANAACACNCDCEKCECGKARRVAGCPFGKYRIGIVRPALSRPLVPPTHTGHGPFAGPPEHGWVFHKLAKLMADNAALRAHEDAREAYEDRLQEMRQALSEAREEIAHLVAERGAVNPKDEILAHWIRVQAEQSVHKDKVLVELFSTLIKMQAAGSSTDGAEKNLETRIRILKKAFQHATAENTKLKAQVGELRRRGKRTTAPRTAWPSTTAPYPGATPRPPTRSPVALPNYDPAPYSHLPVPGRPN